MMSFLSYVNFTARRYTTWKGVNSVISLFSINDTTPALASASPTQTSNNENSTKNKVIIFSTICSVGGLSLF